MDCSWCFLAENQIFILECILGVAGSMMVCVNCYKLNDFHVDLLSFSVNKR